MSCSKMLRPVSQHLARGTLRTNTNRSLNRSKNLFATNLRSNLQSLQTLLNGENLNNTSTGIRSFSSAAPGPEPERMQFQAETKKLLNIVAKSLYTDKEVFIRELISNASDACEKLRFLTNSGKITNSNTAAATSESESSSSDSSLAGKLKIHLSANETERTFTIQDFGIGMTKEELIKNLGTICRSGSLEFLEQQQQQASNSSASDGNNTVIGQFGVGFYSSFVVADKIQVFTRAACSQGSNGGEASAGTGATKAYKWESDGMGDFSVTEVSESEYSENGTKIILHLKEECNEFSKLSTVKSCAKKFSSFVDFPIFIQEGSDSSAAWKELNKQEPLWLKPTSSVTPDEHTDFYRYLNGTSYGDPFFTLGFSSDVPLAIKSILYVPEDAPSRFFAKEPEIGVSLHCRRVLVKKNADGIIPGWLHWLKGVIDCEDMPLNISRESMQDSRLMQKLSLAVVRRFLKFLEQQSKKDPEKYLKFYKNYSYYLKAGLIEDRNVGGRHKDELIKLLRFDCTIIGDGSDKGGDSSNIGKKLISLQEYVDDYMVTNPDTKEKQKNIYYYCCPNRETAMNSPYLEQLIARKRPVLLLFDDIDEFVVSSALDGYKEHQLVAVDGQGKDFELELDAFMDKKDSDVDNKESDSKKDSSSSDSSTEQLSSSPISKSANIDENTPLTEDQKQELSKWMKSPNVLGSRAMEIKFTDRLTTSPAVVTSVMTPHMRKLMKQMMATQGSGDGGAGGSGSSDLPMTLELSPNHPIVKTLYALQKQSKSSDSDSEVAKMAALLLFDNAMIASGAMDEPRSALPRLNKVLEMLVYQGAGYDYSKGEYRGSESGSGNSTEASSVNSDASSDSDSTSSTTNKTSETVSTSGLSGSSSASGDSDSGSKINDTTVNIDSDASERIQEVKRASA